MSKECVWLNGGEGMAIRRLYATRIQLYLSYTFREKIRENHLSVREKSGNYQGISFLDFCGHPVLSLLL